MQMFATAASVGVIAKDGKRPQRATVGEWITTQGCVHPGRCPRPPRNSTPRRTLRAGPQRVQRSEGDRLTRQRPRGFLQKAGLGDDEEKGALQAWRGTGSDYRRARRASEGKELCCVSTAVLVAQRSAFAKMWRNGHSKGRLSHNAKLSWSRVGSCLPKGQVETSTLRTSEGDLIWKQGHGRCN